MLPEIAAIRATRDSDHTVTSQALWLLRSIVG